MKIYDVIIVGSGPAGMTAAIYAKRANLDVLLLDKLAPGGQIINTYEIQNLSLIHIFRVGHVRRKLWFKHAGMYG